MDVVLLLVAPLAVFLAVGLGFAHAAKARAMTALTQAHAVIPPTVEEVELPLAA
jgi:hypothetical protein